MNGHSKPVVAKLVEETSSLVQPGQSLEIPPFLSDILEPGSWALLETSEQDAILSFSILPRRSITICQDPRGARAQGSSIKNGGPCYWRSGDIQVGWSHISR